jgi:hypothetical protein
MSAILEALQGLLAQILTSPNTLFPQHLGRSCYFCMMDAAEQKNNPLHGKTLEFILKQLVWHYGWEEMSTFVKIECFKNNPSMNSSLKFLRKTDWARKKVEKLYLNTFH